MGKGTDHARLDISHYIKRLWEAQLSKADPEKDHSGRIAESVQRMDAGLGPEWRQHAEVEGIEVIPVKDFFTRVCDMADNVGIPRPGAAIPGRVED